MSSLNLNPVLQPMLSHSHSTVLLSNNLGSTHAHNHDPQQSYNSDGHLLDPSTRAHLSPIYDYLFKMDNPRNLACSTGIMPPGVIHIDDSIIVFERPPAYQNIQFIPQVLDSINYETSKTHIYRLPIPWTVYMVDYTVYCGTYYPNTIRMYFANNSLQSSDFSNTRLYLPPLCNFYNNSQLCNPLFDSMDEVNRYTNDIAGVINAAYNWIWNTGTNADLTMNIVEFLFQAKQDYSLYQSNPLARKNIANIYPTSFYIDTSALATFFSYWENLPLEDVSSYLWANPSPYKQITSRIGQAANHYLHDYFNELEIDPDDYLRHDDDGEEYYDYDEAQYHVYLRKKFSSSLNFIQAFQSLAASIYDENRVSTSPTFYNLVNNYFTNISSDLS